MDKSHRSGGSETAIASFGEAGILHASGIAQWIGPLDVVGRSRSEINHQNVQLCTICEESAYNIAGFVNCRRHSVRHFRGANVQHQSDWPKESQNFDAELTFVSLPVGPHLRVMSP